MDTRNGPPHPLQLNTRQDEYEVGVLMIVRAIIQNRPAHIIKGSIFLKNRHSIIQERFNKLICSINTIIKCGT